MMTKQMLYPKQLPSAYEGCDLMAEGLLDVKQSCEFLSIGRATLYELMDQCVLPFVKLGKSRRVPKVALKILAAKGTC